MNVNAPVISIDGPCGSGKGTICHLLAKKLGWHFLDSGVLYRVLALASRRHGVAIDAIDTLASLATDLDVKFESIDMNSIPTVILEGDDVTEAIRSEECGNDASKIAIIPSVRAALLQRQRDFRKEPGLVADGRDMGSVVFPDSIVKIFLIASLEERAKRRFNQLKEKGINVNLERVLDELTARDIRDKARLVAPTKPAPDAIIIDTSGLSVNDVLLKVLAEVEERM